MTNYIKFTSVHLGDSRWLEVGSDAFAVHAWALDYSNKMLRDGKIAKAMALRVALPVPPERTQSAIDALVDAELWHDLGDKYLIAEYDSHALLAEEIQATRDRWAKDKQRQRKHRNGVHDECDPEKCAAAKNVRGGLSGGVSPGVQQRVSPLDQIRPDQTYGSGSGIADPDPADADRDSEGYPPHRWVAAIDDPEHCAHCGHTREHPHLEVA